MRREIQVNEGIVSFVRIPNPGNKIEGFLAKIAIKPTPKPLSEVTSAEVINGRDFGRPTLVESPGSFNYNSIPFPGRMYGNSLDDTFWDITTVKSDEAIAKIGFSSRKNRQWIVGIQNPEIVETIAEAIQPPQS